MPDSIGKIVPRSVRSTEAGGEGDAAGFRASTPNGMTSHVFRHLRRLAEYAGSDPAALASVSFDTKVPASRETVFQASHRLGLETHYEERSLASLKRRDFPAILLSRSGEGWLALSMPDEKSVQLEIEGSRRTVELNSLEGDYAHSLFRIKLKSELKKARPLARAPSAQPASNGPSQSVYRVIIHQVLAGQGSVFSQLLLAAFLSNMLMITVPLFIMGVYDRIIPHLAMETLWALVIGVIIALTFDFGVRSVRMRLTDAIALSASRRMQARVFSKVTGTPQAKRPKSSADVAQAMNDADSACQMVPVTLVAFLVDLPFFLILAGLISYIGGWVVLAPLVGAALMIVLNVLSVTGARNAGLKLAGLARLRANTIDEVLANADSITLTGIQARLVAKFERLADTHSAALHGSRLQGAFPSVLAITINQVAVVFTLVIGVYQVAAGAITVGALAAVTILVGRAIGPIGSLSGLIAKALLMESALQSLLALERLPNETGGDVRGSPRQSISGSIRFNGVSFSYPEESTASLKSIDLEIKAGEKVGIIGRIGCGKSTLLNLIPRLIEPSSGSVQIDDYNATQYDPIQLRRSIAFMTQSTELLDGTLYDNLVAGLERIDDDWLEECCDITGLKDMVAHHADGVGMILGARGGKLSGGERQLVGLTRCLMRKAPIMLLDEPTAALDNRLEKQVVSKLETAFADNTVIISTHRAPLLNLVDRIIVLDQGRIISDKPRDQVMPLVAGGEVSRTAGAA